jgi:chromosome segregation protein
LLDFAIGAALVPGKITFYEASISRSGNQNKIIGAPPSRGVVDLESPALRLTSVKLSGFKSFVDPTSIAVPGQLVGVVGQLRQVERVTRCAGCGGVSAKQLRGRACDVIFKLGRQEARGRASVERRSTTRGRIGAWSAHEISVKRVLSREATQLLHQRPACAPRRTGHLLGTGLGPRAYSIIEQGMISRVALSPRLRVFLEAAGVSNTASAGARPS